MPTTQYRLKDGTKVPGVTTIIGGNLGWNKEPLKYWAWDCGRNGIDYRKATQAAADAGTLAHLWSEEWDRGVALSPAPLGMEVDDLAKAVSGLEAYKRWRDRTQYKVYAIETHLVSEQHRFGGTLDRLYEHEGRIYLGDIKTSKRTYGDHLIQIAAYGQLVKEVMGVEVDGFDILRFGRNADFHHGSYPSAALAKAWRSFQLLRELHELKAHVEALV